MNRVFQTSALLCFLVACANEDPDKGSDSTTTSSSTSGTTAEGHTRVLMSTSLGDIELDLDGVAAPISTENFLAYVDSGFYDGTDGQGATIFHRVLAGFVAQGGGITADGTQKATLDPIPLETDVGLSNLRGTLAMARTNRPDTATSQFYINLVDNTPLDGTGNQDGYAVFGSVVTGMDVVDAMAEVTVDGNGLPAEDILVTECSRR